MHPSALSITSPGNKRALRTLYHNFRENMGWIHTFFTCARACGGKRDNRKKEKSVFLPLGFAVSSSKDTGVDTAVVVYHTDLSCYLLCLPRFAGCYQCSQIGSCKGGRSHSHILDITSARGEWSVILLQFAFCHKTSPSPMPGENSLSVPSPFMFHALTLSALLPWQPCTILLLHYCCSHN